MKHHIFAIALLCLSLAANILGEEYAYEVIVDGGTSGSKPRVYRWRKDQDTPELNPESLVDERVRPGIQELATNLDDLDDYLTEVIDLVKAAVPEDQHEDTPFTFFAAGGTRQLGESEAKALLDRADEFLSNSDNSPFMFKGIRILSGHEEAVYGWVAVNYLNGLYSGDTSRTVGVLELGSGSTQIAFVPEVPVKGDRAMVHAGDGHYEVYGHSYSGYGQDHIMQRIRHKIAEENQGQTMLDNPCMLTGDEMEEEIDGTTITFRGIGDPDACRTNYLVGYILPASIEGHCHLMPCAIGETYQPAIPATLQFYGISAYVYTPEALGVTNDDGVFTPEDLSTAAGSYCQMSLTDAATATGADEQYLSSYCTMGLYLPMLLVNAFGFGQDTTQIMTKSTIDDISPEWALGALVHMHQMQHSHCMHEDHDDHEGHDHEGHDHEGHDHDDHDNHDHEGDEDYMYEVIVDGATTGSKPRVYRWMAGEDPLVVESLLDDRVSPGVQELVGDSTAIETHLGDVIELVEAQVPEDKRAMTRFTYFAAGGVRRLDESDAESILSAIDTYLSNSNNNPFHYRGTILLAGKEEAVFGWVAANYLNGLFSEDNVEAVGVLEMGSSSTQIAFTPTAPLKGSHLVLHTEDEHYEIYGHSYPTYGQDATAEWVRNKIVESDNSNPVQNPCMLNGDEMDVNGQIFEGTGNAETCKALLQDRVYEAADGHCRLEPCAIGETYQPSIPSDLMFYGISAYVYTPETLAVTNGDGVFTPADLETAANTYCAKTLADAVTDTGLPADSPFLSAYCMMGVYIPLLLTEGYGFDASTTNIKAVGDIDDEDIEWALGAMLYDKLMKHDCPMDDDHGGQDPNGNGSNGAGVQKPFSLVYYMLALLLAVAVGHKI